MAEYVNRVTAGLCILQDKVDIAKNEAFTRFA